MSRKTGFKYNAFLGNKLFTFFIAVSILISQTDIHAGFLYILKRLRFERK